MVHAKLKREGTRTHVKGREGKGEASSKTTDYVLSSHNERKDKQSEKENKKKKERV